MGNSATKEDDTYSDPNKVDDDVQAVNAQVGELLDAVDRIDKIFDPYKNDIGYSWEVVTSNIYNLLGVRGHYGRHSLADSMDFILREANPEWSFDGFDA